ncbi:hypothetical protein [Paracoccus sp. ME4]|uniref:hypothetical protein n=1 Tax=Paracoccus sp. ME4 TaxID=3138066 RepID=UPI00398AAF67
MPAVSLTDAQVRAVLEVRRHLAALLGVPGERIAPTTRLRADLDMTQFEIRELRLEILESTSIWLPLDPMKDHMMLEIGLLLAKARA